MGKGQEGGACLGQDSGAAAAHTWGVQRPIRAQSCSPERVDIDEPRGIDWLIIALHVHAAKREEKPVSTPHTLLPTSEDLWGQGQLRLAGTQGISAGLAQTLASH